MNITDTRDFLTDLFGRGRGRTSRPLSAARVAAAPENGRLIVLAAGKAAGSMAEAAERFTSTGTNFPPDASAGSRSRVTATGGPHAWWT